MTEEHHLAHREPEFKLGVFSIGDIISIAVVIFFSGVTYLQVQRNSIDIQRIAERVATIEQVVPNNYVRRDEFREDIREIKSILRSIEARQDYNERHGEK